MIKITRAEADMLRKEVPEAHIAIVNRHKRNKHYFAEETGRALELIYKARGIEIPRKKRRW